MRERINKKRVFRREERRRRRGREYFDQKHNTTHNTLENNIWPFLPFFGLLAFPYSPNLDPMSSRKKVLLKVIILGDSG